MWIILIALGIWGLIVAAAPFGIWSLRARIEALEEKVRLLDYKLRTVNEEKKEPVAPTAQMAATVAPSAEPIPTPKPLSSPEPLPIFSISEGISTQDTHQKPKETIYPVSDKPHYEYVADPVMPVVESVMFPAEAESYRHTPRPESSEREATDTNEPQGLLVRWLTGGRLFVTLGIVLLFMGVAMLFKYMAQHIDIPLELRFIGVAIGAVGMIVFGRKQMDKRRDYGLYMQGGGLGILFLTVFTAFKFYALISPGIALALLVIIGAATFALSVANNSMALSVLAVTGGFLAPILTSTGQGNHITLFSYYLLINLIIFAIAWHKSWRILNTIGFVFTFTIGMLWGGKYYGLEYYSSVQFFLITYFLLYVGIGVLYASRIEPRVKHPVDAASIFGVPLIGIGLQLALVKHIPDGATISAIALGVFYSVLCYALKRTTNPGWRVLSRVFMALAVLFFTLAIPFAFGNHTTAMLFAMEAVALMWMFKQTGQRIYGYSAAAILMLSNIFMLMEIGTQGQGIAFLNSFFLSALVMTVAHIAASYQLNSNKFIEEKDRDYSASMLSLIGLLWWFGAGIAEIKSWNALGDAFIMPCLAFFAFSALAGTTLSQRLNIPLLDKLPALILPAIIGSSLMQFAGDSSHYHPSQDYGLIALPLAFAAQYFWLWQRKDREDAGYHIVGFLTLILLAGFELGHCFNEYQHGDAQRISGWLIAAACGIALLSLPERKQVWPLTVLNGRYIQEAAIPLVVWAFCLCLYTFRLTGASPDGSYIPLLNLVDMAELAAMLSMLALCKTIPNGAGFRRVIITLSAINLFGFLNCLLLRMASAYMDVDYFSYTMWRSMGVQTMLTILWTMTAMSAMVFSSRKQIREGWLLGALLLGCVVLKLFTVDLSGIGTLSRIISFMGVGVLCLALGYLSPMPPKQREV